MASSSRDQIRQFLRDWANSESSPRFAVLIEGRWGSGKTHFINSLISDPKFTERKTIYISLFGISSLQDFERQLFYAASSKTTRIVHRGLGLAASLSSGAISFGSGGLLSGSANIGKAVQRTLDEVEKAANHINDALIVINDLERCSFEQADLLGVINLYIEHGNSRIILLANLRHITGKSFTDFREKVVGWSFELPPDPKTAIKTFIKELPESRNSVVIGSHYQRIEELYRLSNFNNLRSIRQYLWLLSAIISAMDPKYLDNRALLDSIILQSFIFFTEFKQNLDDGENIFNLDEMLPDNDFYENDTRSFSSFKFKDDEPDTPKEKVLRKYGILPGITTAITVSQWIDILQSGTVDSTRFNQELAGAPELNGPDSWPSWKRLWHIWSWDFSDGSIVQFDADIKDVLAAIEEGRYVDPPIVMHVVGVVLMLSHENLISEVNGGWVERFKKYIDDHVRAELDLKRYRAIQSDFDTGYEGLEFIRHDEEDFRAVLRHLRCVASSWYEAWKAGPVAEHMLSLLDLDRLEFLGNLIVINGKGDQRFLREPIMHIFPEKEFVDALLSMEPRHERSFIRAFKERYDHEQVLILEEGPWWLKVGAEISRRILDEPLPPRVAQLSALKKGIDHLVIERLKAAQSQDGS